MPLACCTASATTEVGRRTCIVIVEVPDEDTRHDIGIIVDAVSEVLEIPASEIEPAPSFGAKIRADFIFGMGKGFVTVNGISRQKIRRLRASDYGLCCRRRRSTV
mgnify:CR=1 FL=1